MRTHLHVLHVLLLGALTACSSTVANREPLGERFPTVSGESLQQVPVTLPDDLAGAPAVLLAGYVQDAQFDADRWLIGLLQMPLPVQVREVPTIKGLFVRNLSRVIDNGMRKGIPEEDWASVVTVYGRGAMDIVAFTGSELPRNIRVLLLDAEGRVVWFHDRGFSAAKLIELESAARSLLED